MFLKSNKNLIGLDIGSSAIKAGELVKNANGYTLKRFVITDIPPGIIVEGIVQVPLDLSEILKNIFESHKIKNRHIAFSVGGYSVMAKKISIQDAPEEQIRDAIPYEAEQYIPFDLQDVYTDFHIVGKSDTKPDHLDVLLVAAKKDMVDTYVSALENAGLIPVILDTDAFAMQNAYTALNPSEEDTVALIDIGAEKTSLNIIRGADSLFLRDMSQGSRDINADIISRLNCPPEAAEDMKLQFSSQGNHHDKVSEAIMDIAHGWCDEIVKALDFYYSSSPGESDASIRKIVLSGGGGNLDIFQKQMAAKSEIRVEVFNPFERIKTGSSRIHPDLLYSAAPQSVICIGLSMRMMNHG